MTEGLHRGKESRVFYQDLLSPLGMGAENEAQPGPELGMMQRIKLGKRRE